MPLVDVATAVRELRLTLEPGEEEDLERKLTAAEEQAFLYLGRNVYATPEELAAAIATATLTTATSAYEAAMITAALIVSSTQRGAEERLARDTYAAAIDQWDRVMRGMLLNDSIKVAILHIAGNLWEHRGDEEDIVGVPPSAERFLWHFRGLGT